MAHIPASAASGLRSHRQDDRRARRSRDFDEANRCGAILPSRSAGLRPARCDSAASMGSTSNGSRLPNNPVLPTFILPIMPDQRLIEIGSRCVGRPEQSSWR